MDNINNNYNTTNNLDEKNYCEEGCRVFIYMFLILISTTLFFIFIFFMYIFFSEFVKPCCYNSNIHQDFELYEILRENTIQNNIRIFISNLLQNNIDNNFNNNSINDECSICLENLDNDIIILKCKHGYHSKCFKEYCDTISEIILNVQYVVINKY